ncbi:MAG: hypothetical protein LBM99_00410 [Bacillales bacterium]|jgi:hypothetical protein|nr:hypothetical protein [Bacillales bacterium]
MKKFIKYFGILSLLILFGCNQTKAKSNNLDYEAIDSTSSKEEEKHVVTIEEAYEMSVSLIKKSNELWDYYLPSGEPVSLILIKARYYNKELIEISKPDILDNQIIKVYYETFLFTYPMQYNVIDVFI